MKVIIFSIFFLLQLAGINAQSIIHLQDTKNAQSIGKNTSYFRDAGFNNIQKILQPGTLSQFKSYDQDNPNFGSTPDAVWFKFAVIKDADQDFYLQIGSAFVDSLALYAVNENQVREVQLSGDNYVFSKRTVKVTTFLFPLHLAAGAKQTYFLRVKTKQPFFFPLRVGTLQTFMEDTHKLDFLQGIYLGFMLLIFLYNSFLYFSTKDKLYLLYVAYVASITWFMSSVFQYIFEFLWPQLPIVNQYAVASSALTILTATLFTREFLHTYKFSPRLHWFSNIFMVWGLVVFALVFTPFKIPALILAQVGILLMAVYFLVAGVIMLRKGYQPAKFYLFAWSFLILGFIAAILETANYLPVMYHLNSMQIGSAIEVTLLSLALADRINIYKKQREEAQARALDTANEKSEFILKQNSLLEQKINERTVELTKSLHDLKGAQAQLIQSEKMASLGELTAGVAHEIQNPLNFVNNFSEVNNELIEELQMERLKEKGKRDESLEAEILNDIKQNLEKINHHGKRADFIVKGMLQHSRTSTGERQLTNINLLADEFLKLSYQGIRTKDKFFSSQLVTHFEEDLPKINVVQQDIGRVLLNLFNNAFYALQQKQKTSDAAYKPEVIVKTAFTITCMEISVRDNGAGIPEAVKDKIMQPFFTTKPAGEGTGLGLSLSYDIVVKGHGGKLTVNSEEGKGAAFVIELPLNA